MADNVFAPKSYSKCAVYIQVSTSDYDLMNSNYTSQGWARYFFLKLLVGFVVYAGSDYPEKNSFSSPPTRDSMIYCY